MIDYDAIIKEFMEKQIKLHPHARQFYEDAITNKDITYNEHGIYMTPAFLKESRDIENTKR